MAYKWYNERNQLHNRALMQKNPLHLGASLYVPATRDDLGAIIRGERLANVRSIIFCLEDAVSEQDLPAALYNLRQVLPLIRANKQMFFVRPRNARVLTQVLQFAGAEKLTGFVIPKATSETMPAYLRALALDACAKGKHSPYMLMPTLETQEVFNPEQMRQLHDMLIQPGVRERILSLRIGGNDLFNVLGLRRSRHRTIYESPIGPVISSLVAIFKPSGFNLSAPVCEHLYDYEVLEREVAQDIEYGLFGKTAVHPDQVSVIEQHFKPSEQDYKMAKAILEPDAPAVFGMYGTMCEVATHWRWATQIKERALVYGVFGLEENSLSHQPTQCLALAA